jgi:hypothetical protein
MPFILAAVYIERVKDAAKTLLYQWMNSVSLAILSWMTVRGRERAYQKQRDLYLSLIDHSGFYEDYIHHVIAEEQYDSDTSFMEGDDAVKGEGDYRWGW